MDNTNELYDCIKSLINKKEYNECENIIFEMLENNTSDEIYEIALKFYGKLLEKSNEELLENNFSKIEVFQGLRDLVRIVFKNWLIVNIDFSKKEGECIWIDKGRANIILDYIP